MASLSSRTYSSTTTSYKTISSSSKSSQNNSKHFQNHHRSRHKRISQDKDNQAYRLSSWNTNQLNVNSQLPTIVNKTELKGSKLKTSSNSYKQNSASLFKPKVGLAQSVPSKSLVNILKTNNKHQNKNMNKIGVLGKKPPDKKYYKIVVMRDFRNRF